MDLSGEARWLSGAAIVEASPTPRRLIQDSSINDRIEPLLLKIPKFVVEGQVRPMPISAATAIPPV